MDDENEQITEVEAGYQTFEREAEEKHEAREYFRRCMLRGIRGHLRQNKWFRWWLAWLQVECVLVACVIGAWCFETFPNAALIAPGVGVLAAWPLYVLSLRLRARSEVRHMLLGGHWEALKRIDAMGQINDVEIGRKIDYCVDEAWEGLNNATRYNNNGGGCIAVLFLAAVTLCTRIVWDLLRSGAEMLAEIILDTEVAPVFPSIDNRLPVNEAWYKTALLKTFMHFLGFGIAATLAGFAFTFSPAFQKH